MSDLCKRQLFICDCGDIEHSFVLTHEKESTDIWPSDLYLSVYLRDQSIWKRIKTGIKYILGHKSKYGAWDEILLTPERAQEVVDFIQEYIKLRTG